MLVSATEALVLLTKPTWHATEWAEISGRTYGEKTPVAAQLLHLYFPLSNSRAAVGAELEPRKRFPIVPQAARENLFLALRYFERHIEPPSTFSRAG